LAPRPSACARPLLTTTTTTTGSEIILLLPAAAAAASSGGGGAAGATPAPTEDHQTMLPGPGGERRYQWQWVLDRKPRGKPPPSAPSKRTN
jgi:hypothetical protein